MPYSPSYSILTCSATGRHKFRLIWLFLLVVFLSIFKDFLSSFDNFKLLDSLIIYSLKSCIFVRLLSFQLKALLFSFYIIKSTISLLLLEINWLKNSCWSISLLFGFTQILIDQFAFLSIHYTILSGY